MNPKLNQAIDNVLSDPFKSLSKGNTMSDKVNDAQKKVDEANQKIADSRPGNVVSHLSAFGTPSTYEDVNHPDGKANAQLDEERTQDVDKFNDDQKSAEKAQEVAAEEQVKAAEEQVASAQSEAKSSK